MIMTATTITVDRLLELAKNALVGPSTPMIEELLFLHRRTSWIKSYQPVLTNEEDSQGMVNEERLKGDASFVIMTKRR